MCNKKKIDIFGILETKIRVEEVDEIMSIFKDEWQWVASSIFGRCRIIIVWRKNAVTVVSSNVFDQFVGCDVLFKESDLNGRVIFVYGSNSGFERQNLWQHLALFLGDAPCLVLGDFNATLKQHERRGSSR